MVSPATAGLGGAARGLELETNYRYNISMLRRQAGIEKSDHLVFSQGSSVKL
jgi:hypothetical protein